MSNEPDQKCDSPETLARLIKYYSQEFVPNKKSVSYKLIRIKREYEKNKVKYDKLFEVCSKYNITTIEFVKFAILIDGAKTIDQMLNVAVFSHYANYLKRKTQYANIYKYYMKSANNIADMCIANGYKDTADCLKHLIVEDRLGYEYITGRISKYYLASIQNFRKIFEKITGQSRDELCIIRDVADELNKDVQDTFMEFRNMHVRPISFTDEILKNKRTKLTNNQ